MRKIKVQKIDTTIEIFFCEHASELTTNFVNQSQFKNSKRQDIGDAFYSGMLNGILLGVTNYEEAIKDGGVSSFIERFDKEMLKSAKKAY